MRFADILGLALSALWQQKARTVLTTLGVVFGSFVLAASLSVGQGVRDTIMRQSRRSDYLRRIDVMPGWGRRPEDGPQEEPPVRGPMSDAKRERLRQALAAGLARRPVEPTVPLTPERLRSLAEVEHVEAVVPAVFLQSWATLDGRTERAMTMSVRPDDAAARRVVAGRFLEAPDERAAVVTELLLYQWGLTDDAAVQGVVGKTLHLEMRFERQGAGLEVYLVKPNRADRSRVETSAVDKIKEQLPRRLGQFDLTPAERAALGQALRQSPAPHVTVYALDVPIVGVLRLAEGEERNAPGGWGWDATGSAVLLPVRTAEDLFFREPGQRERGLNQATVIVDREENVEGVLRRLRDMGLEPHAPLEFIQRERLLYTLIFGAMTCVAAVALLVAALGIANTMLMSVLERTREVGVMKAVGAADRHIQTIFLLEGGLIGVVGGGLGLLLGWAASFPGDSWVRGMVSRDLKIELKDAIFVFPPWLVLSVMLFAVLVTTLAAVYPARRAAKVNPVSALRHE